VPAWIDRAANSLVGSFANGIRRDIVAVDAAISPQRSNGQTEGQVTRLKPVKRQMYGRAKLDLLEARQIGAACPPKLHQKCVRPNFECRSPG
jgi:transposase